MEENNGIYTTGDRPAVLQNPPSQEVGPTIGEDFLRHLIDQKRNPINEENITNKKIPC